MPVAKVVVAQRDFSAGELDPAIKRADDHPLMKSGARQMSNWRILNARGIANRPGRRTLALEGPRVDEVLMSPGNTFYLAFGPSYLRVYDSTFTKRFDSGNVMPWTSATAVQVVWDVYRFSIYMTFTGMVPQVLTWDGLSQTSTWTLTPYAEQVTSTNQKRTIFYRLSPVGITCQPSAPSGGGFVQSLTTVNAGSFTSVPAITIGSPPPGGTTAAASATLALANISIASGGAFFPNPLGQTVTLTSGIVLQIAGVAPGLGQFSITSVSVLSSGQISSGSAPATSGILSITGGISTLTQPSFNLAWQLGPLTLTNPGNNYTTNPTVTLTPSGGAVVTAQISAVSVNLTTTLQFSAGMQLTNAYIGTRIRYCNRQILITGVTNATTAQGLIEEQLFPSATYFNSNHPDLRQYFAAGDEVIGQQSGAKAIVVNFTSANQAVGVQYITGTQFILGERVVGSGGSVVLDGANTINGQPLPVTVWDEEVMNTFRSYPQSCFVDQGRLGFCDFPALPNLVAWSAQGIFTDLYTDEFNASATNAIQELVPGKSRVRFIVPGAEGSEFVFCDNAIYYIPINQTTPLQPGSVAFNTLSADGSAGVKPRLAQQSLIFVAAGNQQLKAIQPIGAYSRPHIIDDITELHAHLFNVPVAIAIPGGSTQFEERYIYVVNGDGTLAIGKYGIANGLIDTKTIGWVPWSGAGSAKWISARSGAPNVLVGGTYAPGGITAVTLVEQIDSSQFLDAGILYNNPPSSMPAPGGKGPLWWLANGQVDLMDGARMMGTYQIDANGFLIPQNNAGEDFTSVTLTAGQAWTAMFEPFVPAVQPGQDVNQRMRKRRIQRHEIYVKDSSGFAMVRLFGGPVTPTSPTPGTIMKYRRFPAWNQDDDPTQPPPLREQSYEDRPIGRVHDPRVAILKDTPGSLTILEDDLEVSV